MSWGPPARQRQNGSGNTRCIGATLWMDRKAHGNQAAKASAIIGASAFSATGKPRSLHGRTHGTFTMRRALLETYLARPVAGPAVVVTHHDPGLLCVHPLSGLSDAGPAFYPDPGPLIRTCQPDLWFFGHTRSAQCACGQDPALQPPDRLPGETVPGAQESSPFIQINPLERTLA